MASKFHCWNVRNVAKFEPKMTEKKNIFWTIFDFLETVHTIRTSFSTVMPHHNRVLYMQKHQNSNAVIA